MLIHAWLPDAYMFHAITYATMVFIVLPIKDLIDQEGNVTTPSCLFLGTKPLVSAFHVFSCPCIAKKWTARINGKLIMDSTQWTFIGFPDSQKGWFLYIPSTRQIIVSGDVLFDETFYSTITKMYKPFHDTMALHPIASLIPETTSVLKTTGSIDSVFPLFAEGRDRLIIGQTLVNDFILFDDPIHDPTYESTATQEQPQHTCGSSIH